MSHINLVTATDDAYAQHAGVMLYSAFANAHPATTFSVYILDGGISEENKGKLRSLFQKAENRLRFIEIDSAPYLQVSKLYPYPPAAYYRLALAEVLSSDIDRILYLDPDALVLEDLYALYASDIAGKPLAAVPNVTGISKDFNSGVLLMEMKSPHLIGLHKASIKFIEDNASSIKYPDQDALNHVFERMWHPLDLRYNVMTYFFPSKRWVKINPAYRKSLEQAIKSPAIIHFTGDDKPWLFARRHPYKSAYYRYLRMTPWKDYVPPELSRHLLKKALIEYYVPHPLLKCYDTIKKGILNLARKPSPPKCK